MTIWQYVEQNEELSDSYCHFVMIFGVFWLKLVTLYYKVLCICNYTPKLIELSVIIESCETYIFKHYN